MQSPHKIHIRDPETGKFRKGWREGHQALIDRLTREAGIDGLRTPPEDWPCIPHPRLFGYDWDWWAS